MQARREVKYRAFVHSVKWVVDVVAIDFSINEVELDMSGTGDTAYYRFNEVDLLQFTGVHDDQDQGEEFYDGDIAEVLYEGHTHICKVKIEGCAPMFVADSLPDGFLWLTEILECDSGHWWAEGTKRIGNIYDNPELLEVGN
ncbi:YopX family protein [Brevibacillus sp. M2.1A]|uniref:YopX family protein n=1 Tax=Brevibacillus sp. M2.1A TaxID=2738980 RepID=UPI00156BB63B|nr:YopX family protein [Brevibacillus sp. M2.1A]MCC8435454.1 YopX family protein [Brevibacillus sp. M2.1A]